MWEFFQKGEQELSEIAGRFRKRDFSGNEGQAIKNSGYQISISLVAKFGSLAFTIIMARLLMPELFGLYSLALGTIVLFAGFSDFGISTAMVTFVAKSLSKKNPSKAKAYFLKTLNIKLIIVSSISLILLFSAYFVANVYYNKPIFYALLVGGLYLPISSFLGYFDGLFRSVNKFKYILIKEIIFQFSRLTIVPLAIFFLLKINFGEGVLISILIFLLSICLGISLLVFIFYSKRKISFLKERKNKLSLEELSNLRKFVLPISLTVLSGAFFGYIDTIMLGHFVEGKFIGYYSSAFSLVASVAAIIGFSSGALFPIFARLKGRSLESAFNKTKLVTILVSFLALIATFFLAKYVVLIAYGAEYLPAVPVLQIFSVFILLGPMIGIYESYFTSQERTKIIAILLVVSTLINIGLNLAFINYGLKFGMFEAILGACIATLISRGLYLLGLIVLKRK